MSGRFRRLFQAASSSRVSTTSTLPSTSIDERTSSARLVLGVSMPQSSSTLTLSSAIRSESADASARRIILRGVRWA